jgi:hypothetical protein
MWILPSPNAHSRTNLPSPWVPNYAMGGGTLGTLGLAVPWSLYHQFTTTGGMWRAAVPAVLRRYLLLVVTVNGTNVTVPNNSIASRGVMNYSFTSAPVARQHAAAHCSSSGRPQINLSWFTTDNTGSVTVASIATVCWLIQSTKTP